MVRDAPYACSDIAGKGPCFPHFTENKIFFHFPPTGQEKPREERVGAQFSWSHSAASCCAFLFVTVAISYSLVPDSWEDTVARREKNHSGMKHEGKNRVETTAYRKRKQEYFSPSPFYHELPPTHIPQSKGVVIQN